MGPVVGIRFVSESCCYLREELILITAIILYLNSNIFKTTHPHFHQAASSPLAFPFMAAISRGDFLGWGWGWWLLRVLLLLRLLRLSRVRLDGQRCGESDGGCNW